MSRSACQSRRCVWSILALIAHGTIFASVGHAQSVAITPTPDSVVLGAGDSASAFVLVRNAGNTPVRLIRVEVDANDAVRGRVDDRGPLTIPAGSATQLTMHVARTGSGVHTIPLVLRAQVDPGGTVVATFRVAAGAYSSADQVVDVQFVGGAGVVTSNDRVTFYAMIHNKTDSAIAVGPITTAPSAALVAGVDSTATHGDTLGTFSISAHEAALVPMYMLGAARTIPGKRALTVIVPARWRIGHSPATGSIIATKDVDVDVWGESDLLKVLGIPTFLVLPGFLILVTFGMLWKLRRPWRTAGDLPFSGLSPEFWLFGVTLSGVFAVAATLLGVDQYLHNYNIADLADVWLGSIALAIAVYLGFAGVGWFIDRNDTAHRVAITPLPTDDIFVLLGRLAADHIALPNVQRTIADGDHLVFVLRADPSDPSKTWVAPQAVVVWAEAAPPADTADDEANFPKVQSQPNPVVLLQYLTKYRDLRRLTEWHWDDSGGLKGPTLVDTNALKNRFTGNYLVDKKWDP